MGTPFLVFLAGDPVARSGRFEVAVCVDIRRNGEEREECHQPDRDEHVVCVCVMYFDAALLGSCF